VNERLTKLREGTVSERASGGGTAGRTPEERIQREIAKEAIKAAAKAQGKKVPTGEDLDKIIKALWAPDHAFAKKNAPEVKRRLKAAESAVDLNELGLEL
jgi:3-oxoacyl-[acyl-carrier-protein] synthase III